MAGCLFCLSARRPRWRSFRLAYAELCGELADPYFAHLAASYVAAAERRRGGDGGDGRNNNHEVLPLVDVLQESWPYDDKERRRGLDADGGVLHEELSRRACRGPSGPALGTKIHIEHLNVNFGPHCSLLLLFLLFTPVTVNVGPKTLLFNRF